MKFGEIVLKGRNRVLFYAQLRRNVQRLLRDLGPLELRQRGGVLAVLSPAPVDELIERARDVLGVNLLHPALVLEKTPEAACAAAIDLLRGRQAGRSPFARVGVTRAGYSRCTSSRPSSARRCRTSSGSALI